MFTSLLLSPRPEFLWPFAKAALLVVCGEVEYRGHLSSVSERTSESSSLVLPGMILSASNPLSDLDLCETEVSPFASAGVLSVT